MALFTKPFPNQALDVTCLQYKSFENTVGKGGFFFFFFFCNEQFLLFPVFSTLSENFLPPFIKFKIVVCKLFQFGRVYSLLFGKGLILVHVTIQIIRGWFFVVIKYKEMSFRMIQTQIKFNNQYQLNTKIKREKTCQN